MQFENLAGLFAVFGQCDHVAHGFEQLFGWLQYACIVIHQKDVGSVAVLNDAGCFNHLFWRHGWQEQMEAGAGARPALNIDDAVVVANAAHGHGQPQPAAQLFGGEKRIENLVCHIGRHALAVIANDDVGEISMPKHGVFLQQLRMLGAIERKQADVNAAMIPPLASIDGILHDIEQHLLQLIGIAPECIGARFKVRNQGDVFRHAMPGQLDELLDKRIERELFGMVLALTGECQQLRDNFSSFLGDGLRLF